MPNIPSAEETPAEALSRAVALAGSQAAFGRLVGVSQVSVFRWLRHEKPLPPKYVLTVERELGISRHVLRPDLYPLEDAPPPPFAAEPDRTDVPAPGPATALGSANGRGPSAKPPVPATDDADCYDGAHA